MYIYIYLITSLLAHAFTPVLLKEISVPMLDHSMAVTRISAPPSAGVRQVCSRPGSTGPLAFVVGAKFPQSCSCCAVLRIKASHSSQRP